MTNPSKLEQVARAMEEAGADGASIWDGNKHEKSYWLNLARAAIAAMELPTSAMHVAGIEEMTPDLKDGEIPSVLNIYDAMIRAALKEEK